MPVPVALMAAGTAMQIVGNLMANYSQAQAEIRNAKFFREQAEFAREAAFRQEDIARANYSRMSGAQLSAYAKGNVDISGSAASVLAETYSRKLEEVMAIRRKGELEYKLAYMRGKEAEKKAETLQDPFYNLMQAGGTFARSGMADNMNFGGGGGTLLGQSTGPGSYGSFVGSGANSGFYGSNYLGGEYKF